MGYLCNAWSMPSGRCAYLFEGLAAATRPPVRHTAAAAHPVLSSRSCQLLAADLVPCWQLLHQRPRRQDHKTPSWQWAVGFEHA